MKIKRFNESKIKRYDDLSDDDLDEQLYWLRVEAKEISDKISEISGIKRKRQDDLASNKVKNWSKSIFDLNDEQLEFIFEHSHSTGREQYAISRQYFRSLDGLSDGGFNTNTNQFAFYISMSYFDKDFVRLGTLEDRVKNVSKSLKFLGDKLKKHDGYVKFGIVSGVGNDFDFEIRYYNEKDIRIYYSLFQSRLFSNILDFLYFLIDEENSD